MLPPLTQRCSNAGHELRQAHGAALGPLDPELAQLCVSQRIVSEEGVLQDMREGVGMTTQTRVLFTAAVVDGHQH